MEDASTTQAALIEIMETNKGLEATHRELQARIEEVQGTAERAGHSAEQATAAAAGDAERKAQEQAAQLSALQGEVQTALQQLSRLEGLDEAERRVKEQAAQLSSLDEKVQALERGQASSSGASEALKAAQAELSKKIEEAQKQAVRPEVSRRASSALSRGRMLGEMHMLSFFAQWANSPVPLAFFSLSLSFPCPWLNLPPPLRFASR